VFIAHLKMSKGNKMKKIYKGSNHYAENAMTDENTPFIPCTSYASRVAAIVDGIMFIPKHYEKFSATTSRHLSKLERHFEIKERVVFDERDERQRVMCEAFFPEFS
jgi:hypothetical protein